VRFKPSWIIGAHPPQVNPRGSTGRGEAFCAALYCDWGGPALRDVLAAVDYAVDVMQARQSASPRLAFRSPTNLKFTGLTQNLGQL
jgi:hypothetical protein